MSVDMKIVSPSIIIKVNERKKNSQVIKQDELLNFHLEMNTFPEFNYLYLQFVSQINSKNHLKTNRDEAKIEIGKNQCLLYTKINFCYQFSSR